MFEADKITEKNKKQRFYEKGIYSKIFHPEDNGMDKGEGDKDDGTDDGKNDDGGKDDGSSGGNNGDAGNVGGEPQPTPDNDKSESESGKNDVSPSLAILLPISALIVLPLIIASVKSIRKKR